MHSYLPVRHTGRSSSASTRPPWPDRWSRGGKTRRIHRAASSSCMIELIAAGLPPIAADVFVDTYRGIAELAETSGDLRALIGRSMTSLAEAVAVILSG
jgi:hypothetical protein